MKGTVLFRTRNRIIDSYDAFDLLGYLRNLIIPTNSHSLSQFPYWFGELAHELDEITFSEYLDDAVNLQYKLIIDWPYHQHSNTAVFKKFVESKFKNLALKNKIINSFVFNETSVENFLQMHARICSLIENKNSF